MTALKTTLLATAAVFALGTAAQAADPILPAPTPIAPAPALTHDWSGFYAGINAGFGSGTAYGEDGDAFEFGGDFWDSWSDPFDNVSGFLGGVQAGANFQTDMFVLGIEGDIQLTTMSQTVDTDGGNEAIYSLDHFGTLRARAGVAIDNMMPYLTGGLAFGYGTLDVSDTGLDTVVGETHVGWTIGGGVEVAMDDSVSFKAEYLYTDLGTADYDVDTINTSSGAYEIGVRFHTVRAGVNFHF